MLVSGAEVADADIPRQFSSDDLVVTDLFEGKARVWTDFRLHPDGFGRQLVLDVGLCGNELKNLVQRM